MKQIAKRILQKSFLINFSMMLLLAAGTQILLTGYTHKHERKTKASTLIKREFNFRTCPAKSFFTLTDRKGNRNLLLCDTPDCREESIRIKLNKKAQWEISNSLRYSNKNIEKTLVSTMLRLSPRASGFMLSEGVNARILQARPGESIVGDLLKGQKFSFSNGKKLRASGEQWRECESFDAFLLAVRSIVTELKQRGPKDLSGYKYLAKLESELIQAKIRSSQF